MAFHDLQTIQRRKTTPIVLLVVLIIVLSLLLIPQNGQAAKKSKSRSKAKIAQKTQKSKNRPVPPARPRQVWIPDGALTPALGFASETLLHAQANEFLGTPYRPGGSSKNGMDCSGLVKQIFSRVYGIELPHSSNGQSQLPMMEKVAENELQPGDLIFFGPGKKRINHVGVYLADGKFLHASRTVGVTVSDLDENYWRKRLITYKRPQGVESEPESASSSTVSGEIVTTFGSHPVDDRRNEWSTAYRQNLLTGAVDLSLGAFMETLDMEGRAAVFSPTDFDGIGPSAYSSAPQLRQGLRISGAIRPFDWLSITPSLSIVDRIDTPADPQGPLRVLAIEALMRPLYSPWTLAMTTRAISGSDPLDASGDASLDGKDANALDLTLGLHYNHSKALSFSLIGTHDRYRDDRSSETSFRDESSETDLTARLNYRF